MATAGLGVAEHVALARNLPERLLRFFANNPPSVVAAFNGTLRPSSPSKASSSSSPLPPPSSTTTTTTTTPLEIQADEATASSITGRFRSWRNPFLPTRHPVTKRWHPPIYSLRRQAELFKLARAHHVESLMPFSPKSSAERLRKRQEHGLRVKGTGVGQKVKGHAWERRMEPKLEKRRQAMLDMPRLVNEWKLRGHGRGIKKWPK